MGESAGRVLIVDDDAAMCDVLERGLARRGFDPRSTTSSQAALERIGSEDFDVVLTDLRMKGLDGIQLCARALEVRPGLPVVVITAFGSLDTAISAIRAGAYDFVTKPIDTEAVALVLERAVQHRRLREEVTRLRAQVTGAPRFEELLGESPTMRRVYDLLDRITDSDATVLVTGESGTGKELVARALHRRGRRRSGPFVAINCAALPETLLETELFGHAKGAFTDARTSRAGLLARANGGTLFLDEIAEMPLSMQAKLLRVLQERTVRPVGGEEEVAFDVRLVAATNDDLAAAVAEGRFREDLYFRLNVIQIDMPPLRARGNDVLLLAHALMQKAASAAGKPVSGISPEAAKKLLAYDWPGNVRELSNCIERAVALARFDHITVDDLPEQIVSHRKVPVVVGGTDVADLVPLEEVERLYIVRVLEAVGGHRASAAKILGLDRKTLYRKLERWRLSR